MALTRTILLIVVAACFPASGVASSLTMLQNGWQMGGPLTVSLTGQDTNHDGQIDLSELSAFSATYDLPQGGSTTWSIGDLQPDFSFMNLGNFVFDATNPNYSLIDTSFQGQASGSVIDAFLFPVDQTDASPIAVPEPSEVAWAGLALLALLKHK